MYSELLTTLLLLGCVDIDDALHIRKLSEDLYEVGVRILLQNIFFSIFCIDFCKILPMLRILCEKKQPLTRKHLIDLQLYI